MKDDAIKRAEPIEERSALPAGEASGEINLHYRSLFENSPDGITLSTTDGAVLSANPMMCEMLGMSEQEVIHAGRDGIAVQDERLGAAVEQMERTGRFRGELTLRRKDGSLLPVELSCSTFRDRDGIVKACQVFRDITHRKRVDAALEEELTRRRVLFEQSPDGILIIDPETARFLEFNTAAHRQLGYSREAFAQLSIFDLEATETPEEIKSHVTIVTEDGEVDFETLQRTREGELRNVHVTAQMIDIHGHPVFHATWRDVTERRRTEEENATLAEIGKVVSSSIDIDEIYEGFAAQARRLIRFDRVSVNLINHDDHTRTVVYISGLEIPGMGKGDILPLAGSLNEKVLQSRRGLIVPSTPGEEPAIQYTSPFRAGAAGVRSSMFVPLISKNRVIGTLFFHSTRERAYGEKDLLLAEKIAGQIAGAVANARLYSDLEETGRRLQKSENALKETLANLEVMVRQRTVELEEANTTLKVLVKKGAEEQNQLGENLQANINQLVKPFLSKIGVTRSEEQKRAYLNVLETNLNQIASPFINALSTAYKSLTPKELKTAALVKEGKTSKEIAALMGVSVGTVVGHRNNIRRKLHLKSKGTNLRSYLISHK